MSETLCSRNGCQQSTVADFGPPRKPGYALVSYWVRLEDSKPLDISGEQVHELFGQSIQHTYNPVKLHAVELSAFVTNS